MSEPDAALLRQLQTRFEQHPQRHPGLAWVAVAERLQARPALLQTLQAMEASGGEPDLVVLNGALGVCDCAAESPSGRRSLCYDRAAREGRKQNPPAGSALEQAEALGATLLDESQYRALQQLGAFDRKTSSWLLTPPELRALGGALFGDRRYERVFTYHNGADAYYAARGFRAWVPL
ncbi:DUF4256 domain-containing protein [Inhella proteolytica]|nr:DUF4256 domain-containing protein [Inhella proteolytica]